MTVPEVEIRAAERLLADAVRDPATGCLEVSGFRDRQGYGRVGAGEHKRLAHRLVMTVLSGVPYVDAPAPVVRHLCNNAPCVNPLHLRFGTRSENARDSVEAGTHRSLLMEEKRARTRCPRGHALAGANLVPYQLALGKRTCLTCFRARTLMHNAKKRGQDIPLARLIASELSRTDGGRDLVARDALGKVSLQPLALSAPAV